MNTQTQEALKMAIEALSQDEGWFEPEAAIQACKEALTQPAQEPYGYWVEYEYGEEKGSDMSFRYPYQEDYYPSRITSVTKLYTHPAPSWQGLSDDEVNNIYPCAEGVHDFRDIVRAIEQALKEKNT